MKERILFSVIGHSDFDASPDLILTEDFNGVNAGMGDLHTILLQSMLVNIRACPTTKKHLL